MNTIFTVVQINEQIDDPADWAEPFISSYRSRTGAEEAVQEQVGMLIKSSELPEQTTTWFSIGAVSNRLDRPSGAIKWKREILEWPVDGDQAPAYSFIITETLVEE